MYASEVRYGRRIRVVENPTSGSGRDIRHSGREKECSEPSTLTGGTVGSDGLLFLPDSFYVDAPTRKIIL
jgi:hypothetical protein